ncbi:MAG: DUF2752 domain-containing protein [Lentisphaeria bacterium]|nr:DUF2752 domain-containing protein [Lentisphaeria bacterium]
MKNVNEKTQWSGMQKFRIIFLVLAALGVYWLLIGRVQICLVRLFSGLPCPGCGLTRAGLALLRGDWRSSFYYHPLLLPIIFTLVTAAVPRWRIKKPLFYITMLVLLLGVYAVRMVLFFPHTEPMDFEYASLLGRVLKFFQ